MESFFNTLSRVSWELAKVVSLLTPPEDSFFMEVQPGRDEVQVAEAEPEEEGEGEESGMSLGQPEFCDDDSLDQSLSLDAEIINREI